MSTTAPLQFVDELPKRRRAGAKEVTKALIAGLVQNTTRWAVIDEAPTTGCARLRSRAQYLKRFSGPTHIIETAVRGSGDTTRLYARAVAR